MLGGRESNGNMLANQASREHCIFNTEALQVVV